jgi:pSer/pThr/pTyr-binding forkhead associated (FHA) protein
MTGTSWVSRRFPIRIGRSPNSDLRLEEVGVWNEHAVLQLDPARNFSLIAQPEAIVRVNGKPTSQAVLRNGDTIELGVVRLQFWLEPARQRGLRLVEVFTWVAFAAVTLGEVILIYTLLS